jgi:outer membrane protein assembly factor BamB
VATLTVGYFRCLGDYSHQQRNLRTMLTCLIAGALLWLWVLFLSRLGWKVRGLVCGAVIGLLALVAVFFEIHGVTGDLRPILKLRWRGAAAAPVGAATSLPAARAPQIQSGLTNDFPQFMGPLRNATVLNGPKLARDWSAQPPQKLWRQPIGPAWSGFAVVGSRALTQEQRGAEEIVVCYDLFTGAVLWTHADRERYHTTIAGEGPRCTPSIVGQQVVTLGGTGLLNCLELATGRRLWSRNLFTDNEGKLGEWGAAGSPLVLDGLVIVNPGGQPGRSLVAYRLSDGQFVWGGGDDRASYSSPMPAALGGLQQVLIFNQHAIFGHDAATGRVLWRHPWDSSQPHVALPVALPGDRVLVSSGYGVGSELLHIHRGVSGQWTADLLWKTKRLKAKFNNLVTRDGHVYGLDDGILACVELATGDLKWKEGRYGHGQFILVGDLLLVTAENGDVALIEPVPTERRELTRFSAVSGKTWNPPALAGDLLLVRNDQEAACYRLAVEK